jgi:homoaconitate hydratase
MRGPETADRMNREPMMPQNLIEKIAQRYALGLSDKHVVRSGDFLTVRPAHVMTHDNTSAVMPKFFSMGATRIADPKQPVFALDHDIQNTSPENLAKYAKIEAFAKEQGVSFFPAGRGIGHQVMVEEGFVLPGTFVVGSDSHSNLYGALGALGTPVVRTDAAAIWATERTWWQVPEIVRLHLTGVLQPGVSGKDVIIALCGIFNQDEVLNCYLEFTGPGVTALGIEDRLTISNMTTEWGALGGSFPYDAATREFLLSRAAHFRSRGDAAPRLTAQQIEQMEQDLPEADSDAFYAKELTLDLSAITPFVAGPNEVKTITALPDIEVANVKIQKAFLMSCVNGRLGDFEAAAAVVAGRKIHDEVKLYIAAASSEIEAEAQERGYWKTLLDAGATALPAGCGACIGLGEGILKEGEVGISATNRNFKGRMGSRDAFVYLSSPAVVAASALAGKIAGPRRRSASGVSLRDALAEGSTVRISAHQEAPVGGLALLSGFPQSIEGELLFLPQDNLNTDGIYGKEFTYQEGLSPDEMGTKAMLNYDPKFQTIAQVGDILVGGFNFGSGSSREQAATALKYRGIQMIIAGSYSQTYKRNAFNNGYIVIECPDLVDELKAAPHSASQLTVRLGRKAKIDFSIAKIESGGKTYSFAPLGEVAQELIVEGGFEEVIRKRLG